MLTNGNRVESGALPAELSDSMLGEMLELEVGAVAHGGHWVARADDGRVVFVRHALTGERVRAEVTEERGRYLRADAVELLSEPAPGRVTPPCVYAGACGGCDFQHVDPAHQRELKAAVVREQLVRLGRLPEDQIEALGVRVEPLEGSALGWRSRMRYTVDAGDRAGLRRHRAHEVVPVQQCLLAHPRSQSLGVLSRAWPDRDEVAVVASSLGDTVIAEAGVQVRELAIGREWTLPADVFWQVHPAAPDTFAQSVVDMLQPQSSDLVWDLYGGVGLFAAAVAVRGARALVVESNLTAVSAARAALTDLPGVQVVHSAVERFLGVSARAGADARGGSRTGWRAGRAPARPSPAATPAADLVVLDPPRVGAGAAVCRALAASGARAVCYVACDPAAFARDVATFQEAGWRLARLRCFDAFPNTHHVELIGLLVAA